MGISSASQCANQPLSNNLGQHKSTNPLQLPERNGLEGCVCFMISSLINDFGTVGIIVPLLSIS